MQRLYTRKTMNKYYVIRLGGRLFVTTRYYHFYQGTTKDLEHAYKFKTYEDAAKVCRHTIGGKIEEHCEEGEAAQNETTSLKETIKQQQKMIEDLQKQIKEMKGPKATNEKMSETTKDNAEIVNFKE